MGLLAGFVALGGFLIVLTLTVVWAASLERWMERQELVADELEVAMRPAEPRLAEAVVNPANIRLDLPPARPERPDTEIPSAA
jgi:hypothetical protein